MSCSLLPGDGQNVLTYIHTYNKFVYSVCLIHMTSFTDFKITSVVFTINTNNPKHLEGGLDILEVSPTQDIPETKTSLRE